MPKKQLIAPEGAKALAPYSPGLSIDDLVFVSGQGPVDCDTGEVLGNTIEEQTELTIKNVERILKAAGCTLDDCVKATVHLRNIGEFDKFNSVYKNFFNEPRPTRTTVESVLWSTIKVEIDVIAIRGCGQ